MQSIMRLVTQSSSCQEDEDLVQAPRDSEEQATIAAFNATGVRTSAPVGRPLPQGAAYLTSYYVLRPWDSGWARFEDPLTKKPYYVRFPPGMMMFSHT